MLKKMHHKKDVEEREVVLGGLNICCRYCPCKTREKLNFFKKGKTVIYRYSTGKLPKPRVMERASLINSSRG